MRKGIYIAALATMILSCKEQNNKDNTNTTVVESDTLPKPNEEIVLFDGTDLNAWKGYGVDEVHANWTIDGDAMMFTPGDEGG